MTTKQTVQQVIMPLVNAGISVDDAYALRRISMTLQRWFELECGNGNNYGSWAIVRGDKLRQHGPVQPGKKLPRVFIHDDNGKPFMEHHHYSHGNGRDDVTYSRLADRETGARKRLAKIVAKYPGFTAYVQTDPRGAAVHIMRPGDVKPGDDVSCCYTRGISVYR